MTTRKPDPDYEAILAEQGMPVTEEQVRNEFNEIVKDAGLITNTSRMSPFWRLITAIITRPVIWLKNALVETVMRNAWLATAGGVFLDLFAWAVNLERKDASAAEGVIRFAKSDTQREVTVPAGTIIQTERINGKIHQVITTGDRTIAAGVASALLPVVAVEEGAGANLAPGYYRILPVAVDGIASAQSEEDWLTVPGADIEADDDLRDRTRNQFNLVGQYHIDAVYRGMIAGIAGLTTDRIYFEHDAPRGPGTANVYLLLDAGVASTPFIQTVNNYVMTQGNHGHGDDVLCIAMPETRHDIRATVYLYASSLLNDDEQAELLRNVTNMIRCAFRENSDYQVEKTWPYNRFSMSRLGEEIHQSFADVESVVFSTGDILSDLNVPRLGSLVVVYG
ncbi:baseplate J/gp47 family protein [Klebsiella michiganensis]|uniref:baseplate J/gp47 family protein n=1 Tax=Klebsiella TaxID=570 RepID=UPI0021D8E14E|nr:MULTISPECIES: baseplate J/gp47 family protein [Klebsiella]UYB58691.1 baseplate J/gp47 family protein [Klebsiella michiganensis]